MMALINKANVWWAGLPSKVVKVIRNNWQPGSLRSEIECRDSLAAFLRQAAPDAHIETEYRHTGTTTDIYMKWHGIVFSNEIFIELKYNLKQKTEYDRLIGQITQLNPNKRQLIVVLCGDHDENFVARLRERYKQEIVWISPRILIKKTC